MGYSTRDLFLARAKNNLHDEPIVTTDLMILEETGSLTFVKNASLSSDLEAGLKTSLWSQYITDISPKYSFSLGPACIASLRKEWWDSCVARVEALRSLGLKDSEFAANVRLQTPYGRAIQTSFGIIPPQEKGVYLVRFDTVDNKSDLSGILPESLSTYD